MILELIVASSLTLASGAGLPQDLKGEQPPRFPAPNRLPRALPPTPERNLSYVLIENGGDIRLPMSRGEMERYGYSTGQIITLGEARRIVEEKLRREGD